MANIVIKGVYTSKSALDTAELENATEGDTYIVGSKIPYDLYTYKTDAFKKGDKVSNVVGDLSTPVSIDDVTADISVSKLQEITFKNGSKSYKIRKTVGRGNSLDTFEFYNA